MKTARSQWFRTMLHAAVPIGLLATVTAATVFPGFLVNPELVGLALSGLIVYAFGALALLGRRRTLPLRVWNRAARTAPSVVAQPAAMMPVRPRVRAREREQLAA